jgi:N utilization substance protein B
MARSAPPSPRRRGGRDEVGPRRQAREAAVQILYGLDAAGTTEPTTVEHAINAYWGHLEGPAAGRAYADELVRGVMGARDKLDEAIRAANPAWRIERMARVDRNIIRVAAYEMLLRDDVPAHVAIDEAVELAKRFGTEDSPAFVNGTLDKVARMQGKL